MAISDEGAGMGTVMPVAPMGNFGGGFGNGWGGDGSWLILFILLLCFGGWNNGNGWGGNNGMDNVYPWLVNGQNNTDALISTGFQNAAITSQLSGIQNSLTSGFSGAEVTACNRAMDSMQTAYGNQIASMNQRFADQQALTAQLNGIQAQQASCCCENRLATANLASDIAREACADRQAVSDALRDVIASNTAQTQAILDRLTENALEAKNDTIAQLRSELMYARGQASQDVQTSAIQAGQRALANEIEQYVLPTPRPAYIVGNPNCCQPGYTCGCGA